MLQRNLLLLSVHPDYVISRFLCNTGR